MPSATRIYSVSTQAGTRLVEAPNKSQAINHVARDTIQAEVAPQKTIVSLIGDGVKVEVANAEPTTAE